MIFGKLVSGHFDILMSQYSQVNNSGTSWLRQNIAICSIQKGLDTQITSKHIQAPQIRLNTTQIPSDTPRGTPQTSPDNTRRQQMPTDANRHQQTLPDSSKSSWQCPLVSVAVCWSLLLSVAVCCCLSLSSVAEKRYTEEKLRLP